MNGVTVNVVYFFFLLSVSLFKRQTVDWLFFSSIKRDRYSNRHQCCHCLSAPKWCSGFLGLRYCRYRNNKTRQFVNIGNSENSVVRVAQAGKFVLINSSGLFYLAI